MDIRPDILEYLSSPFSWVIVEILAIILFLFCMIDILKRNEKEKGIIRLFELLGFVIYAGLFENIGVLGNVYDYSLDRLMLIGVVPLSILMLEAVIFYSALRFAETMEFPKIAIPFVVAFLGVLQDLTIDPVAVYDLNLVNGVMEGRWNWTLHYNDMLFGIPFFNYTGWFMLMFYYTGLILIKRDLVKRWHDKNGEYFLEVGIGLTLAASFLGVLLIVSPLTQFILFLYPIFPLFGNRSAEILMLSCVMLITLIFLVKYRNTSGSINYRNYPLIWIIPAVLHLFDMMLAFFLGIVIAYIPVILFSSVHLGYIGYYIFIKPKESGSEVNSQ
ncbi:MAG: hypothetical protein ACTSP4_09930 [Candidatus Hodarchaeales archaeon]